MTANGINEKTVVQVCIIVADVERTAARYREILGFNIPHEYQITRFHDHTQAQYYGQPTNARAKISCFDLGRIQFELLQPLEAPSTWKDFLDQHGEGIHHIAFFVANTDGAVAAFAEQGYQVTQQGLFTGKTGKYTYLDTNKDLAIVIELLEHFSGSPVINGPAFPPARGIGTDIVAQVGIIVHDIEQVARRYGEVLGIPVPGFIETPGYAITKTTYHWQPSDATAKLAFFDLGQVQLELIQPDEKPSVWRSFLETRGQGAHHIAFQVKDTKAITGYLEKHGMSVEQQGMYADGTGMYTYIASEAMFGTAIELLESF